MNQVQIAAQNNAHVYERVCAAHGVRTERVGDLLICLDPPPPYFSQAVTLAPGAGPQVQTRVTGGFKDGFHDIVPPDPEYRVLFSADWIWRESAEPGPLELEWQLVKSETELAAWEEGWAGGHPPSDHHQFPASLLAAADLQFWTAVKSGNVVGVVLLNNSGPVVGVSNLISPGREEAMWRDLPRLVASCFPGMPLTGYERDESLEFARRAGFRSVGPLRIWTK